MYLRGVNFERIMRGGVLHLEIIVGERSSFDCDSCFESAELEIHSFDLPDLRAGSHMTVTQLTVEQLIAFESQVSIELLLLVRQEVEVCIFMRLGSFHHEAL